MFVLELTGLGSVDLTHVNVTPNNRISSDTALRFTMQNVAVTLAR